MNDTKDATQARLDAYRAAIEKRELSHNTIYETVNKLTSDYVSRATIARTLSPNDPYINDSVLDALNIVLGEGAQWKRLLSWLELGNSITAFECFTKLGFTQLHGRLLEIQRRAGYEVCEAGSIVVHDKDKIINKMILWQWENDKQYKRYWIPATQTKLL